MKRFLIMICALCVLLSAALAGVLVFQREEASAFVRRHPSVRSLPLIGGLLPDGSEYAPPPSRATVRVRIPEGYTVRQICALLAENGVAEEADLLRAAAGGTFDYAFVPAASGGSVSGGDPVSSDPASGSSVSGDPARLEGYLFPDTYDFFQPEDPVRALDRMLSNFSQKVEERREALHTAQERGEDLRTVVIIASLIEKETDGTDQGKIASVIHNRLYGSGDRGGTYGYLQIDAAVLYALPDHTGALTKADLEVDSPFNLYKHPGLPPAPIGSPSASALDAALCPEETDFYYYALAKDGFHRFFSRYRDFTAFLKSGEFSGN